MSFTAASLSIPQALQETLRGEFVDPFYAKNEDCLEPEGRARVWGASKLPGWQQKAYRSGAGSTRPQSGSKPIIQVML
jgi:hypothetical protein